MALVVGPLFHDIADFAEVVKSWNILKAVQERCDATSNLGTCHCERAKPMCVLINVLCGPGPSTEDVGSGILAAYARIHIAPFKTFNHAAFNTPEIY